METKVILFILFILCSCGILFAGMIILTTTENNISENLKIENNSNLYSSFEDPLIFMTFNGEEYADEARNLLKSIQKNCPNRLKRVVIGIVDDHSSSVSNDFGINMIQEVSTTNSAKKGTIRSRAYNEAMARKVMGILYLLKKGHHVLYTDTDIVFLHDPIPQILNEIKTNDIAMQNDSRDNSYVMYCAGFVYFKPTKFNINLLNDTIKIMENSQWKLHDQQAINKVIHDKKLQSKISVLSLCKFANGIRFFGDKNTSPICKLDETIIIHNNHTIFPKDKKERFKLNNLLF